MQKALSMVKQRFPQVFAGFSLFFWFFEEKGAKNGVFKGIGSLAALPGSAKKFHRRDREGRWVFLTLLIAMVLSG
ncbi:MAG: hypothetical protein ACP5M4_11285 [Acidobacteriaceae bacterium]